MKYCGVRLLGLLFTISLVFHMVSCDVDYLEYKGGHANIPFARQGMAPSETDLQQALEIIEAGGPLYGHSVSWAYSIVLEQIGLSIGPESILSTTFTVGNISGMLNRAGLRLGPEGLPAVQFVMEILERVIAEFSGLPVPPEDSALATLALSLASRGITDPDQISASTVLTYGDVLILLTSIYQSPDEGQQGNNTLAGIIDDILDENGIDITGDLPDYPDGLITFIEDAMGIDLHNQGVFEIQ